MQMIQVSVVKFHICVCGRTSFHYLDHILVISKDEYLQHVQSLFAIIYVSMSPQIDGLILELLLDLMLLLHCMFLINHQLDQRFKVVVNQYFFK